MYHEFFPKVPYLESSNDNIMNDSWKKNVRLSFRPNTPCPPEKPKNLKPRRMWGEQTLNGSGLRWLDSADHVAVPWPSAGHGWDVKPCHTLSILTKRFQRAGFLLGYIRVDCFLVSWFQILIVASGIIVSDELATSEILCWGLTWGYLG